jgi:transposase InsO family protein
LDGRKNRFGIDEIVTAYRSPWQNGYVERVIGSIRRECLDNVIVLNENHLRIKRSFYMPDVEMNRDRFLSQFKANLKIVQ